MKPEPASTTYTSLEPIKITAPRIKVTKNALKWLSILAEVHEHEVGIFGCVDQLDDGSYLIRDIFYPKHSEANGGTCEISPEGETLMAQWLIDHNRENDVGKVKFWAHSHVNMGVSPSGQDETQSIERMERNQSYFIRGIFNKSGDLSISFYDYANKRRFDHIKWESDADDDDKIIRDQILKLKEINIPTGTPGNFQNNSWPAHEGMYDGFNGMHGGNYRNFQQPEKRKHKKGKQFDFEFNKGVRP